MTSYDPNETDLGKRLAAVNLLGKSRSAQVVPELLKALEDPAGLVQAAAATALGEIGDMNAVPGLIAVLRGNNEFAARDAAEALGKIGSADAVPALLAVLRSDDWRTYVTDLAEQAREKSSLIDAAELTDEAISYLRETAALALGAIGDARAIDSLREAASDERDESVAAAAATALQRMETPDAPAERKQINK